MGILFDIDMATAASFLHLRLAFPIQMLLFIDFLPSGFLVPTNKALPPAIAIPGLGGRCDKLNAGKVFLHQAPQLKFV